MTDAQIFQWLGITFFAMGIGMFTNPKFIKNIAKDFANSTANVFYGGLACLAISLPVITFHNVWTSDGVLITLLGWMGLFKGLALLMFPLQTARMYKRVLAKESMAYANYVVLALGIILLYLGYFA